MQLPEEQTKAFIQSPSESVTRMHKAEIRVLNFERVPIEQDKALRYPSGLVHCTPAVSAPYPNTPCPQGLKRSLPPHCPLPHTMSTEGTPGTPTSLHFGVPSFTSPRVSHSKEMKIYRQIDLYQLFYSQLKSITSPWAESHPFYHLSKTKGNSAP